MTFHATTIVAVQGPDGLAMAGDGQVTMGETTIMKGTARKVRRLYGGQVLAGFAGSVADAFTLFESFEKKLEANGGHLTRAAIDLAKEWRSDKVMRQLEALLLIGDGEDLLLVSGNGEVIQPEDGIGAIGSGGNYALAAARALKESTDMAAPDIARKAMEIAAGICVYTNDQIIVEHIRKEASDDRDAIGTGT